MSSPSLFIFPCGTYLSDFHIRAKYCSYKKILLYSANTVFASLPEPSGTYLARGHQLFLGLIVRNSHYCHPINHTKSILEEIF